MRTIEWTDELAIGIDKIDSQHRRWISLLNSLITARAAQQTQVALAEALGELYIYTLTHFMDEEAMFTHSDYDDMKSHQEKHREFTEKILEFKEKYDRGDSELGDEMINYLRDWLVTHITTVDPELARLNLLV